MIIISVLSPQRSLIMIMIIIMISVASSSQGGLQVEIDEGELRFNLNNWR